MERSSRRSFQGVVVNNKNAKTIAVLVVTRKPHPKYKKLMKVSKKFFAHDEDGLAQMGDTVTIMETRPLSATKRFRLVSVDKKGVEAVELKEETTDGSNGN